MEKKTVIKQINRKVTEIHHINKPCALFTVNKDNWPIRRVFESRDHHNTIGCLPAKITSSPKSLSFKHSSYIQYLYL